MTTKDGLKESIQKDSSKSMILHDSDLLDEICMVDIDKCSTMLSQKFDRQETYQRSSSDTNDDYNHYHNEYYSYEYDMSKEDDWMLLEEICETDVSKCQEMMDMKFLMPHRRRKRSVDEEYLLEMALLTEGTYSTTITSNNATSVSFQSPILPAGEYNVILYVEGQGNAIITTGHLISQMSISTISLDNGSVYGGQDIVITGSGFCDPSAGFTTVKIGGSYCTVKSVKSDKIVCITLPGSGTKSLLVNSCGSTVSGSYTYNSSISPSVTLISPPSASGATLVTITGTNF